MTRRAIVQKWILYCLCALVLLAVQDLILVRIRIGGVHPFLLPALAVIPVTLERGGIFLLAGSERRGPAAVRAFADPAADVPAEHLHRSGADADGQGAAAVAGGHAAGTYLVLQGVPPDAERMTKRSFP